MSIWVSSQANRATRKASCFDDAPESWNVNGGRGTITYWEPGLALVVRQTDDVHEQIGGVLRVLGHQ